MKLVRSAPWLLLAVPALVQADSPLFEPELDLDMPALTGAPGDQTAVAAAGDGQRFLVAWRTTLWKNELRVARMTAAGEVLDPRGIRVDGFERPEGRVAVAAGGGAFLVAWSKEPNRIQAARVTVPDTSEVGEVILGTPALVADLPSDVTAAGPAVAWYGGGFWVLWSENGSAAGVYAARVSPEGRPVDQNPIKVAGGFGQPSVAWDGNRALAAWTAAGPPVALRVSRLEADGRVLDPEGLPLLALAGEAAGPSAIAWGGGTFLAVGSALGKDAEIRATRISPDGRALDGSGLMMAAATTPAGGPSVTWDGGHFVVVWSSESIEGGRHLPKVAGRLVAPDGATTALDTSFSASGAMPFVVGGARTLALWSEVGWWTEQGMPVDLDLRGAFLDPGRAPDTLLVARGTNAEAQPVVAWNGERLLIAWEDRRADKQNGDIYAARLTPGGDMLDAMAIAVGTGPWAQRAPAAAWDGKNFVVAWHEGERGLALARVSPDGVPLDRPPLMVAGTEMQPLLSEPALCGDGDGALLVWAAGRPPQLQALRVPAGGAAGASFVLGATADAESPPVIRIGCNDRAALLAWTGHQIAGDKVPLQAAHLPRGQTSFTPPGPIVLEREEGDEWAGVGTDGRDFLVSWRNFDRLGRRQVVGVRIDGAGQRLDDQPLAIGNSNSGHRVSVVWDGQQYLVFAVHTQDGNPFELRARRISRDGRTLDPGWLPVAVLAKEWSDTGNGSDGVMVAPGRAFVAFDQFSDEDATSNVRVRGLFVSSPPPDVDGGPPPEVDGGPPPEVDGAAPPSDAAAKPPPGGGGCGCALGARPRGGLALLLPIAAALRRRVGGRKAGSRTARCYGVITTRGGTAGAP